MSRSSVLRGTTWKTQRRLSLAAGFRPPNRRFSGGMLQQRVNSLTGESEWVVVSEQIDEPLDQSVELSLSESLYLDMLNDRFRNLCFDAAIRKLASASQKTSLVLDIGAGTGLLSLMAHRAFKEAQNKSVPVTSCDSYLPMYKLARKILKENGVQPGEIRLLHMRSDEIKVGVDMPRRADALVCEILDSELLGEGVIPSLRHAHQHLLQPGSPTVPYRATMFAQLVESDYLWRSHDLEGAESQLQDGLVVCSENHNRFFKYSQYALHADAIPGIKQLSEPFQTFTLDFFEPPDTHAELKCTVDLIQTGTAHAIVSWWVLQLDEEGSILYSTAPQWIADPTPGRGWNDHWKQCVWFIPRRGIAVKQNGRLEVVVSRDETSVWYQVGDEPSVAPTLGLKLSPERSMMLGDRSRRTVIRSAVQKALQNRNSATCLVLDDSFLCAVCALTQAGDTEVFASFPGVKADGLKYLNGVKGLKTEKLSLLSKDLKLLTAEDFKGKKVDVLLAEPYYATYEKMLPWKPLRFWYERTILSHLLSENATILPCRGTLYGMAFFLPDLWKSRCSLDKVEGFSHSSANRMIGACGNLSTEAEVPLLPFSIWQCGEQERLTEPVSLLELDFSREIESLTKTKKVQVSKSGICHGVVFWMDWGMDSENLVLSTGPSAATDGYCWKQGVKLFSTPKCVSELQEVEIQASFDKVTGEVSVCCL